MRIEIQVYNNQRIIGMININAHSILMAYAIAERFLTIRKIQFEELKHRILEEDSQELQ